jgi:hypothetical protein
MMWWVRARLSRWPSNMRATPEEASSCWARAVSPVDKLTANRVRPRPTLLAAFRIRYSPEVCAARRGALSRSAPTRQQPAKITGVKGQPEWRSRTVRKVRRGQCLMCAEVKQHARGEFAAATFQFLYTSPICEDAGGNCVGRLTRAPCAKKTKRRA